MEQPLAPVKFTRKYKVIWAIISFGGAIISTAYGAALTIFYQDYIGLGSYWIGLAAIIYAIWNAFNDPLFGYLSDKTKTKHGRRIPYIRWTAPFLGITIALVFLLPGGLGEFEQFIWMLITMLLYDTCYTIIFLVYSALLPEVTESDSERGSLKTYAAVFSWVGLILGFLLPDIFLGFGISGLQFGMIGIGVVGSICILITAFYVKERLEFSQVDQPLGFWESIKYTFKSKSFLVLTAANFMSILMQALVVGSAYYLADYVLHVSSILTLIPILLGLLIGTVVVNLFAKRFGVVKMQQILLVIAGIMLSLVIIVPNNLIYVCLFFAGLGLSGPNVLTDILFAEVSDEDELRSGVRREAAFFGTNALLTKPAQSIALWIVPAILEATNFVTREENGGEIFLNQPSAAITGIKAFVGLIPGIAMLLGALILTMFPLKGAKLRKQQEQILELHAEKKKKLDQMGPIR